MDLHRIWTPSAATSPVVSLEDMKVHLRVTGSDEDYLIQDCERAAVAYAEGYCNRLFTARAAILSLPYVNTSKPIELPGGPVSSVSTVTIDDEEVEGAQVIGHSPAILIPARDWRASGANAYPMQIAYIAGHDTPPPDAVAAIKLLAGELFSARQNSEAAVSIAGMPLGLNTHAHQLLHRFRIWLSNDW